MLDGPQALAIKGANLRDCERKSAAVGKTPDRRPELAKPFAGFICSSLELFTALKQAGIAISPPAFVDGVSEVYPGHIWTLLSGRRPLPRKSTEAGRLTRRRILETLGVFGLPSLPTHDQNDACVSALVAAAADGQVRGMKVKSIGSALSTDLDDTMREGPMVIPEVTAEIANLISTALDDLHLSEKPVPRATAPTSTPVDMAADELLPC